MEQVIPFLPYIGGFIGLLILRRYLKMVIIAMALYGVYQANPGLITQLLQSVDATTAESPRKGFID